MKTYIIRAVKYFIYFCILLTVIMTILVQMGLANANLETMFKNGYNSFWQIGLFFAFMSALYPKFGYTTKRAHIPGEASELRSGIIEVMENKNYYLESEDGDTLMFRFKSPVTRLMRMYEDRITLTKEFTGYSVEGPTKDVVRVVAGLEYKLNPNI